MPDKDEYNVTKQQLMADIDVSMGGKVAEEIIFGPDQVLSCPARPAYFCLPVLPFLEEVISGRGAAPSSIDVLKTVRIDFSHVNWKRAFVAAVLQM